MVSLEYVAGFFDGEGCFSFAMYFTGTHAYLTPQANVGNNDVKVLEQIKFVLELNEIKSNLHKQKNRLPFTVLNITGRANLLKLVQKLAPYLVVKRQQAKCFEQYLTAKTLVEAYSAVKEFYETKLGFDEAKAPYPYRFALASLGNVVPQFLEQYIRT